MNCFVKSLYEDITDKSPQSLIDYVPIGDVEDWLLINSYNGNCARD